MSIRLRPYEARAVDRVLCEWRRVRSTLVVGPTGSGKTVIFCKVAERRRPRGRVLILADRQDLVDNAAQTVERTTRLSVDVEMAERRVNLRSLPDVVCASVQTMSKRLGEFAPETFATVVFDEADLSLAPTYRRALEHFGGAKLLGVTATPDRHDGQALSQMYESVAFEISYAELMPRYVSRIRQQSVKVLELRLIKRNKCGDFDDRVLGEILSEEKILHEVVTATRRLARKRRTLVFAATVEHARKLAAMFNRYKRGSARAIDGDMDADERRSIIDPFESGDFQFLCNCALLARGVDIPSIACIAMARPTMSRPLYAQMVGRGTRLCEGKRDLLVIDFVDNALCHPLVVESDITAGERAPLSAEGDSVGEAGESDESDAEVPRTVSIIDAQFPGEPEEVRLLAGKLLEESPGADVGEMIRLARRQLSADAALRAHVLAVLKKLHVRDVGMTGIDWSTVMWAEKSNLQISKEFRISGYQVKRNRPSHIPSPYKSPILSSLQGIDWSAISWAEKTNVQIASELRVSSTSVAKHRPSNIPSPNLASLRAIDWSAISWAEKTNNQIAKDLKVSISVVRGRRPSNIPSHKLTSRSMYLLAIDWSAILWAEKTNNQIARELKVSKHTVRKHRPFGTLSPSTTLPLSVRLPDIDWSAILWAEKTNAQIARELRIHKKSVRDHRPSNTPSPFSRKNRSGH